MCIQHKHAQPYMTGCNFTRTGGEHIKNRSSNYISPKLDEVLQRKHTIQADTERVLSLLFDEETPKTKPNTDSV